MFQQLKNLPDNVKNVLAIILSIVIILLVVFTLNFLNRALKDNLSFIRDLLG